MCRKQTNWREEYLLVNAKKTVAEKQRKISCVAKVRFVDNLVQMNSLNTSVIQMNIERTQKSRIEKERNRKMSIMYVW